MAKKKKTPKTKPAKKTVVKRTRKPKVTDILGIPAVVPTDPKIKINESARDKMFSALARTKNEDLLKIIEVYGEADKAGKRKILDHYERNGNAFINAVFRGVVSEAKDNASDEDKKLLDKVK